MALLSTLYRTLFFDLKIQGSFIPFLFFYRKEPGGTSTEIGKQKESDRRDDVLSGLNR